MPKLGEYTRLYVWQLVPEFSNMSDEAFNLWPHLLRNPWSNGIGLYEINVPVFARTVRLTEEALLDALDELAREKLIEWDAENACVFVINQVDYNYRAAMQNPKTRKGLIRIIGELSHLSLYPRLLEAYPGLADELPPPGLSPSRRLPSRGDQNSLRFVEGEVDGAESEAEMPITGRMTGQAQDRPRERQESPPVKRSEEDRYNALRKRAGSGILRVYDAIAPVMAKHSKQPRGEKDWKGKRADLAALKKVAAKTRGVVERLPDVFAAVFEERWEELEYYRSGKGSVETISGLATEWRDGTLKAVALVKSYEAACRKRGVGVDAKRSRQEIWEELSLKKQALAAVKESPATSDETVKRLEDEIHALEREMADA